MRRRPRVRNLGIGIALLLACGSPAEAPLDPAEGSGTGDGSSGEAGSAEAESDSGGDGDTGTTGGAGTTPALGISITQIDANQGVATPIARTSEWVDGPERNARLVRDRDTLVRVAHVVEPGWVPRLIEARLEVVLPDATVRTYNQVIEVSGNSDERFLDSSFYWGLVADEGETQPGTLFQVSLWEVEGGGEALTPAVNVSPASGHQQVGFEAQEMGIKMVFVPITYQGVTPDMTDYARETITTNLYEQNPVIWVDALWHAPIPYSGTLNDPGPLLSVMQNLRAQEGAASNEYYAAIVDMGSVQGSYVAGIANLGGNVSANRYTGSWSQIAETITHEVGHNQGLPHIQCPGQNAAGPDPSYPYPNGTLGGTGFAIKTLQLFVADQTYDYMSYCGPRWASDFGWRKNWERIESFTAQGFVAPETTPSLQVALYPDGSEEYWTHPAPTHVERQSGNHLVRFERGDEVVEVLAELEVLSDDRTIWLTAPLPRGGEVNLDEWTVSYEADGEVHAIDSARIRQPVAR